MARRAAEGTPLAPAFEGVTGSAAVIWGSTDIVSLAKEVVKLDEGDDYEQFKARGGVMDGQPLSPEQVKEVSKWPGREELLSLIAGQAIGVASTLAGQLTAPAQQLASQIEKLIEMKEQESGEGAAEGSAENS